MCLPYSNRLEGCQRPNTYSSNYFFHSFEKALVLFFNLYSLPEDGVWSFFDSLYFRGQMDQGVIPGAQHAQY